VLLAGALMLAAILLDPWVWGRLGNPSVDQHDWGRLLRVSGSLVFWAPLALAVGLERRARAGVSRSGAWKLLAAPLLAGALAELLKLLIRRERPGLHAGTYAFRGFSERLLDSHDLGFPSSHSTVAFAGAAVLARLYPRAAPVGYALAFGCAATRLLSQAHFTSDVVAGGIIGWAVGSWLGRGEASA
jgi:membrane-associated phospholipid phosphatase